MDILKYISFSLLENIGQKSRSDYRGETQKFTLLENIGQKSRSDYRGETQKFTVWRNKFRFLQIIFNLS